MGEAGAVETLDHLIENAPPPRWMRRGGYRSLGSARNRAVATSRTSAGR